MFVGFNPSPSSLAAGHRYAHPSNRFWALLYEAGLTAARRTPAEDAALLAEGYGFTEVVHRATAAAAQLSADELAAGGRRVRTELARYRPRWAAYTGKGVYRAVVGLPAQAPCAYGAQSRDGVPGVHDFVLPSPSGRTGISAAERLRWYRALAAALPRDPAPTGNGPDGPGQGR